MAKLSKKRRAPTSAPKGPDRKKPRRVKLASSDSDESISLYDIPSHPPSPDLPRTTRSTGPGPIPAPARAAAPAPAAQPAAPQPDIPQVSTRSAGASWTTCLQCVKKWTETEGDLTICLRPRDAPMGKCRSCSQAGAECSLLPNQFYDPLAAAQKLTRRAQRRACASLKKALEAYERENEEEAGTPSGENPPKKKPPKEKAPKENPAKENGEPSSSGQERPGKGELLKAIRSLDKNVVRLINTIREVRGLELISDEA